jgi:hypothetical protein
VGARAATHVAERARERAGASAGNAVNEPSPPRSATRDCEGSGESTRATLALSPTQAHVSPCSTFACC